ncbi:MAG: hypothetical protein SGI92_02480 [Bryobacteraceae bacterium]|nr:hypothetical protein [Bryobacteraceae bacterium]
MKATRRSILKTISGATPLATVMAGLPRGWAGAAYASDAPEKSDLRSGIIALTDNASS